MYGSSALRKDSSVPLKMTLPWRIIITLLLMRQRRSPSRSNTTLPSSSTTAYSEQMYCTLFISWVTKIDDTSSRSRSFIASSQIVRAVGGSRPAVGSSNRTIFGSPRRTRAVPAPRRLPLESDEPQHAPYFRFDFVFGHALFVQAKRDVVVDGKGVE